MSIVDSAAGVYIIDPDGVEHLVHLYQGGPYNLADVKMLFDVGRVEETSEPRHSILLVPRREMSALKTMADAYSFDYEEPFIEMCQEMVRFGADLPGDTLRFVANFIGRVD